MTDQKQAYKGTAGSTIKISVTGRMWLSAGDYFITLGAAHLEDGVKIDFIEDAIGFKVLGPGNVFTTSVVNLESQFEITCGA